MRTRSGRICSKPFRTSRWQQEQQRREHPRARHMRLERGEARAAGTHVLGHVP
jgi:hypothetical protein